MGSNFENMPSLPRLTEMVDEMALVVRVVADLSSPEVDEGYVCQWTGMEVSLEEAARYVPAVAWNPREQVFEPFVATQRLTQFEWGASGVGLTFLLDVASSISSDLVIGGLAYAVGHIRGRRRQDDSRVPDLESAASWAREAARRVFEIDEHLEVVEASSSDGQISMTLKGASGVYRADIATLESGEPFTHIRRTI